MNRKKLISFICFGVSLIFFILGWVIPTASRWLYLPALLGYSGCAAMLGWMDWDKKHKVMVDWVSKDVDNTISIIKDAELLDINTLINCEKAEGRAKHVLCFPRWIVLCGYYCIKTVFGKSNKTYLVFKALWPFRTA